jgi:ABC-type branched-subunit amino acid transport system permease subunit
MPAQTRCWSATVVFAAVGAATAAGLVWFTREQPQPPGSAVLDNGLRSPMPVIVIGPPLWVYLLAGTFGALVGAGIAMAALRVRGRTSAEAD